MNIISQRCELHRTYHKPIHFLLYLSPAWKFTRREEAIHVGIIKASIKFIGVIPTHYSYAKKMYSILLQCIAETDTPSKLKELYFEENHFIP